ncbi:hypothetical protein WG66_004077 [Moniliophthora roreri]|nr:hypothetical protein WG66_004077 [Moniliophthora roreri]
MTRSYYAINAMIPFHPNRIQPSKFWGKYLSENPPNHTTLDREVPKVGDLLQSVDDEIAGYDSVLSRMLGAVRRLQERRARLWKLRERLRWTMGPSIRRLPSELLLRIFYTTRSIHVFDT